jgi:hypothetical protein
MVVKNTSEDCTTETLRLTAEMNENLSVLSGVAYEKLGAIFPSLVAPTPAPTPMTSEWAAIRAQLGSLPPGGFVLTGHSEVMPPDRMTGSAETGPIAPSAGGPSTHRM